MENTRESAGNGVIPPKRSGRPRSPASSAIEALGVNERAGFRMRQATVYGIARNSGRRLGRSFTTRREPNGVIAVWRVS